MKFEELLKTVKGLPLIETAGLIAFCDDPRALAVQLVRWTAAGKLVRLKRGVYLLAREYRTREPAIEYVANLMTRPSFVSLEYALSFHGLIPEAPGRVTSVTTGRTGSYSTPIGEFDYRHVGRARFFGYRGYDLAEGKAWIATPARALVDLVYFSRGEHTTERIDQLRLQRLEQLNLAELVELSRRFRSPKVTRAARRITRLVEGEKEETFEP